MVTPLDIGVVLVGLALALVGAAVSVYAVTLTGLVVGAGAGYVLSPHLVGVLATEAAIVTSSAVAIGGLVGAFLAYFGLKFAVIAIGAIIGGLLGGLWIGPTMLETTIELAGAAVIGGGGGALVGFVLTRTTLVVATSLIGAAFASRSVTIADFERVQETGSIDPLLFELTHPLFLGLVVLGILTQVGLFKLGYVTKIVAILPGARRWTASDDRG